MAEEKTKVSIWKRIGGFFRSIRSEMKKIVWFSWEQTWKNTLVVLVTVVVVAVAIGLLDLGFTQGIIALTKIF